MQTTSSFITAFHIGLPCIKSKEVSSTCRFLPATVHSTLRSRWKCCYWCEPKRKKVSDFIMKALTFSKPLVSLLPHTASHFCHRQLCRSVEAEGTWQVHPICCRNGSFQITDRPITLSLSRPSFLYHPPSTRSWTALFSTHLYFSSLYFLSHQLFQFPLTKRIDYLSASDHNAIDASVGWSQAKG